MTDPGNRSLIRSHSQDKNGMRKTQDWLLETLPFLLIPLSVLRPKNWSIITGGTQARAHTVLHTHGLYNHPGCPVGPYTE